MKKTVKINISGIMFHLDEDAYEMLQNYLAAINQRFASTSEGKEIISDIEYRIAEILQSKLSESKQVITLEDINEIIAIMGKPEDFDTTVDSEPFTSGKQEQRNQTYTASRKLYRDPDNRILGGVIAGIGAYTKIDPVVLRIILVALIIISWFTGPGITGFSIVVYLVLWIVIPEASSTEQKLHMRGEKFNLSDIEKNVRKEYETVKHNLKNIKNTKEYERSQKTVNGLAEAIGAFFRFIFKFIVAVFGLALIVMGVGFLLGITGTIIIGEPFMPWNNLIIDDQVLLTNMLESFIEPNTLWLISICAILVVFIPLLAIIYGGFKLLLGIRPNDRPVAGIGFVAWLLSLIVLVVLIGTQVKHFSLSVKEEDRLAIQNENKTIYIKANETDSLSSSKLYIFDSEFQIMYNENDEKQIFAYPEIDIVCGKEEHVVIEIEKEGRGPDRHKALENAKRIKYNVIQKDSLILFDPVYSLMNKKQWFFPEVDITIKIPKGYIIYIDENLEEQLDYIEREDYYRKSETVGRYWIMTKDGLEKYDQQIINE